MATGEELSDDLPTYPMPLDLRAQAAQAERLGQAIFERDEISAKATDALLAKVSRDEIAEVRGWVTIPGPWWKVAFLVGTDSAARVAFEVSLPRETALRAAEASVLRITPPRKLDPEKESQWRALATAKAAFKDGCTPTVNPVVVPGALVKKSGVLVYLLASTDKPGMSVWGGHQLFEVSEDGSRVVAHQLLSQCSVEAVVSGTISRVVRTPSFDVPNEGHVFSSLSNRLALYLVTRRGVWKVYRSHIEYKDRTNRSDGGSRN